MKPYVLCHMVSSVDGRIWGSRWRPKVNIVPNLFERLHDQMGGGSWLCGRVTAQEFAKGKGLVYPPTSERMPRENWYADRAAKTWGIFLDAHGKAVWHRRDIAGDAILVILTEQVPDSHLAALDPVPSEWLRNIVAGLGVIVAEQDGAIVGFVAFGGQRDPALGFSGEIHAIYLRAGAQGQGLGRKLMRVEMNA